MKKIILLISLYAISFQTYAWRESHGGNSTASEFISVTMTLMNDILFMERDDNIIVTDLYSTLANNVEETRVISEDKLVIRGMEFEAINYIAKDGTKWIKISDKKWKGLSMESKERLILHEYLSLAGLEETGKYFISTRLYEDIRKYRAKLQY